MKTINIKGKEYVPVVERVKEFHKLYPMSKIETQITHNDDKRVIVKATVHIHHPEDGIVWSIFYRTLTGRMGKGNDGWSSP